MRIPVLSMYQPWASWVMLGYKTIETRTHNKFKWMKGQRIAIHATLKYDPTAIIYAAPYLAVDTILEIQMCAFPPGHIIVPAFVSDYRMLNANDSPHALIDCFFMERYGLFLSEIRSCVPYPFKGSQHQQYIDEESLVMK